MSRFRMLSTTTLGGVLLVGGSGLLAQMGAQPQQPQPAQPEQQAQHRIVVPQQIQWQPLAGYSNIWVAPISGDPAAQNPFILRVRFADNGRVPPHWHPSDEHVTVLSGHLNIGMGKQFDGSRMQRLGPGGYAMMPAKMPHFVLADGETVIQISGMGPFVLNYVNPADDPASRQKAATSK